MSFVLPDPAPLGIALAGAAALQLVLYLVQLRTRNAGIVDAGWATSLALMGVYYAFAYEGDPARRVLIAVLVGGWGKKWPRTSRVPCVLINSYYTEWKGRRNYTRVGSFKIYFCV